MRFMSRSLTGLFLLAVTLALLALAAVTVADALKTFMSPDVPRLPPRERVFAANVVTFMPGTVTPVMEAFGEVRARRELEIRVQTGGPVVALGPGFEEGGQVTAGQLLLRVDPTDLEDALALARTDLAEAESARADATAALDIARDDLAAAQRQAGLRAQALARQKDLAARGVGTAADVETAELADAAAQQAVLSRRSALADAEAKLAQSGNTLERGRIALAEAERRLSETAIAAAFSGTLSGVTVVEGGVVSANEQVAKLVDPTALEVAFRVSTAQYARLLDAGGALIHAPVAARLGVGGVDLVAHGRIDRESAEVGDGLTGRLLFATLDEARGFRPGDFVTVAVDEPALAEVALLPAAALDAADKVLAVGDDNRLEEVSVELLRRQGDRVLVRAPDLAGRDVVAARAPALGIGIKVRPVYPGEGAGAEIPAETQPEGPGMIVLDEARRARLIDWVQNNDKMQPDAKKRFINELSAPEVSAATVSRIESRMGSE